MSTPTGGPTDEETATHATPEEDAADETEPADVADEAPHQAVAPSLPHHEHAPVEHTAHHEHAPLEHAPHHEHAPFEHAPHHAPVEHAPHHEHAPAPHAPLTDAPALPGQPPFATHAPIVPPPPPRPPKPPVVAQRTEDGYKTEHLALHRGAGTCYLDLDTPRGHQRIYLGAHELKKLVQIATSPYTEPGVLWRKLSEIPLDRPYPSRSLDEELRVMLTAVANERA